MADLPYAAWFAYIRKFLAKTSPVVELFSGPGRLSQLARAEGYTAFALDRHFPFLEKKAGFHLNADACAIPFQDGSLGTLIAPNCGLNYLRDAGELLAHFRECCRVLGNGGFYIFDICPEERATGLHNSTQTALAGKVSFAHRYQSASKILETTVTVRQGNKVQELHRQYVFGSDEIMDAARAAGFTITERTENYALPAAGPLTPVETWVLSAGKDAAE